FLTASVLSCLGHGRDLQVPTSVKAIKGSCVMVSCRTGSHDRVTWYKYKGVGYPIVYSTNTADISDEFRGRTSVPGSPRQGNCTLQINNIRQEDNGIKVYPWIYPEESDPYKYIPINIVEPKIHISIETSQLIDGNAFTARCTVQFSCPPSPPLLEWMGLSSISDQVTTNEGSEGLWTLETRGQFTASRLSKTLSCKSIFSQKTTYSTSVSLNVSYAPTAVKVAGADTSVAEGSTVTLTCTSESNPEPTGYEWLVTQKNSSMKPSSSKTFSLRDVKRDMSVSCTARNSVGQGQSDKVLLEVRFPPTILVNSTCSGSAGAIQCVCRVEAEPKASVSWTVNGRSARFPNYTTTTKYAGRIAVAQLTGPSASSVLCEASNHLGKRTYQMPIQRSLTEVSPTILKNSTCFGSPGGIQCMCQAEAEPKADILWMVDGSSPSLPHFNTTTQYVGRITVSELTGPPARNVSCMATNILGTDSHQMLIQRPEGSALMKAV
ncbi:hypothetical protein NFI96_022693, partial [Prochilodus magdalenae]